MKYLKDESGNIYKGLFIDRIFWNPHGWCFSMDESGEPILYDEKKIVAQSDSLEDLCDEFIRVVHYIENAKPIFVKPSPRPWDELDPDLYGKELKKLINEQIEMKARGDDFDLYAANWTDKGLIYVAKWNGKEWDLV